MLRFNKTINPPSANSAEGIYFVTGGNTPTNKGVYAVNDGSVIKLSGDLDFDISTLISQEAGNGESITMSQNAITNLVADSIAAINIPEYTPTTIANSLNITTPGSALDATKGKVLNERIDYVQSNIPIPMGSMTDSMGDVLGRNLLPYIAKMGSDEAYLIQVNGSFDMAGSYVGAFALYKGMEPLWDSFESINSGTIKDLATYGLSLANADYTKSNVTTMNQSYVDFSNSKFDDSYINGCYLSYNVFRGCQFNTAYILVNDFSKCNMDNLNVYGGQFIENDLFDAKGTYMTFGSCSMYGNKFQNANISNSSFSNIVGPPDYTPENFMVLGNTGPSMSFKNADMNGCTFEGCQIHYPIFTNTNLNGVSFGNSTLYHPELGEPGVAGQDFNGVTFIGTTIMYPAIAEEVSFIGITINDNNINNFLKYGYNDSVVTWVDGETYRYNGQTKIWEVTT